MRAARFVEPSAAERSGTAGPAGASTRARVLGRVRRPVTGRRPAGPAAGRAVHRVGWLRRSHRNAARFLALLALLLGIGAAGVLLMIRQGTGRPGHTGRWAAPSGGTNAGGSTRAAGAFAPLPGASAVDPALDAIFSPGLCLTWTRAPGGRTTTRAVDCARDHLDEVTAVLDLRAAGFSSWPGHASLLSVAETRCAAALVGYAPAPSGRAAPSGPPSSAGPSAAGATGGLVAAAAYPDGPAWRAGAHHLACTARAADGSARTGSVRSSSPAPGAVPLTTATAASGPSRPAAAPRMSVG